MSITNLPEAQAQLAQLIDRALDGEDVLIAKADTALVRLTPVPVDESPRLGGQWRGRVQIAEDFDTLPADVAAALGCDPQ